MSGVEVITSVQHQRRSGGRAAVAGGASWSGEASAVKLALRMSRCRIAGATEICQRDRRHGRETDYVAWRQQPRRPVRFSKSGQPAIERLYRTHWVSPELSELKRQRRAEKVGRRAGGRRGQRCGFSPER
jgi:hypothetical protein